MPSLPTDGYKVMMLGITCAEQLLRVTRH